MLSEISAITRVDLRILHFIQDHMRCAFLDKTLPYITLLGDGGIFWILLAMLFLLLPKKREVGFMMALSLVCMVVIGNLTIKPLVARVRPFNIDDTVKLIIEAPDSYSFPSGHTGASFTCIFALLFLKDKNLGWAAVLGIIIAFSRLYLFVHYPTDILGGILVGIVSAFIGVHAGKPLWKRFVRPALKKLRIPVQ